MFYLKTNLPSGKVVKTDITDENIFTLCPECGRELPIDLAEVFSDGEGDLFSTSILCASCTLKRSDTLRHSDGIKVTVDGIALLADALCSAGYAELVYDLFDKFGIASVQDLHPEQYEPLAEELKVIVAGCGV